MYVEGRRMRGTPQADVFQQPDGFDFREGKIRRSKETGAEPVLPRNCERNEIHGLPLGFPEETREGVESRLPPARKLGRRMRKGFSRGGKERRV
jgi:hypothetical protein